jgi:hypothetical protein
MDRSNGISTADVHRWFRRAFRRGPWPDQLSCESVAEVLERERAAKPKSIPPKEQNRTLTAAIAFLKTLPERRVKLESYLPVEPKYGSAKETFTWASARVNAALQELNSVEAALRKALPSLDFPPQAATRRRPHETKLLILVIARYAAVALHRAGRRELSLEPDGPLVDFIVRALEGMGRTPPPHATVATTLRRSPATKRIPNLMRIPTHLT